MTWRTALACALAALLVPDGTALLYAQVQVPAGITSDVPPGPLERSAKPVTVDNPIPRRISAVIPSYPADAPRGAALMIVGVVGTVDASGRVAEARAFRNASAPAPPPVEAAALDAIQQWVFEPPADPPLVFQVQFVFTYGSETMVRYFPPSPVQPTGQGAQQVAAWLSARTKIPPRKIRDRRPELPSGMRLRRGESLLAVIEIELDADGRIVALRPIRADHERFMDAAMEAVREWRFSPAMADGKPVPFTMSVSVGFVQQ